jgi:hypothetical protein
MDANSAVTVDLAQRLQLPTEVLTVDAVRVTAAEPVNGKLLGTLTIQKELARTYVASPVASADIYFPHVAHGGGLYTGLAIASGELPTTVTIEVHSATGETPHRTTLNLAANQQLARVISELVPITTQVGGYIRIQSSEPVWAWIIYGSDEMMASAPPL